MVHSLEMIGTQLKLGFGSVGINTEPILYDYKIKFMIRELLMRGGENHDHAKEGTSGQITTQNLFHRVPIASAAQPRFSF